MLQKRAVYPFQHVHEHLNGSDPQDDDNAGGGEVLDIVAADVVNDVNDSSENVSECLHCVDAQVSEEADYLKT